MAGLYLNHVKVAEESGGIVSLPNTVQFNNLKIGGTEVINSNRQIQNITGIDFSPSSGTGTPSSNLLDDYEEGTFTPVYRGSTTAGTYNYLYKDGWYTKIGNVVHVIIGLYDIRPSITSPSSEGSGYVEIAGLPFASASNTVRTNLGGVFLSRFNLTGETYCSILFSGSNYIMIFRPTSGSSGFGAYLAITDRASVSSDIGISITYQVD